MKPRRQAPRAKTPPTTTIADVIEIPESVHAGDFVLRLGEGVNRPERTLDDYVVTPALVDCFAQAMSLIRSAVEDDSSKGAFSCTAASAAARATSWRC